ncbi:cell division protein SepF [Phascolarctobacterium sp.]|uniref:cell division protein SepF n=1 Tax=Phascolarctobacterium sp. TaxID=2049039 RepID=UPI003F7F4E25
MKFVDKIMDSLNIFTEEEITEEELLAEEKAEAEKKEKRSLFAKKTPQTAAPAAPEAQEQPKRSSILSFKSAGEKKSAPQSDGKMASRTLNLPVANKLVTMVVLEPVDFDDSQKIADYLRNNQPVVVNFANTDNVLAKRMTDFLSGTVYALAGSMKKLSRNILVCAPKNIDIDSDMDTEEGSAFEERRNRPWEK